MTELSDPADADDRPSKSELKRRMHALQEIGERLVALPQNDLDRIPIEDARLEEAISQARRITARGGLKRQLQFIGKLMRSVDPAPIEAALAALDQRHAATTAAFHQLEAARDKLLAEGDNALGHIMAIWPAAEPAHIRQWHRQYLSEVDRGREKQHAKKLFRYLASLPRASDEDV